MKMCLAGVYMWMVFSVVVVAVNANALLTLDEVSPHSCQVPGSVTAGFDKSDFCYEKLCRCYGTTANCSHSFLTYIPSFNWTGKLEFLVFSDNKLTEIPDNFFQNVTEITYLDLGYNNIHTISNSSFNALANLEIVILKHNYFMTNLTLNPVFEVSTLRCVDISRGNLTILPRTLFAQHAMPNLEFLYTGFNYILIIDLSQFEHLPKLRLVDWSGNTAVSFLPGHLHKLQYLYINNNRLYNFPETCDGAVPYFPNLQDLNLKTNMIPTIDTEVCLPRLERLDLSSNMLAALHTNMFPTSQFHRLKYLYLENMGTHIMTISRYAFNNTSLQKISLMYDDLKFSQEDKYSDEMLAGCPGLTMLMLTTNVMTEMSVQRFLALFGHLRKLENLYIGTCGVGQTLITQQTFATFPRLKVLQMYRNLLTDLPDGIFDHNPSLSQLLLADNNIKVVWESTFSEATLRELKSIDLSGNPFSCDCDLRWFSDWLRRNFSTTFRHSRSNYTCSGQGRLNVRAFRMVDQACLLDPLVSQIIIFTISFLVITVTGAVTLFRFRWHFRLLLYEAFRGTGELRRRRLEEGVFDYDIFVSYAGPDLDWIRQQLMPELEDRLGLKLCIHERDFLPGGQIVDNIVESVNKSRKVLMVFSKYFVRSQWCQFELQYCLRHVMDYDDTLLVACVDNVASCDMTSAMMAVMKTTTWLQWMEKDENAKLAFWGRLLQSLREIRPV